MAKMNRMTMVEALDTVRRNMTQFERCDSAVVGDGLEYSSEFMSLVFSYSRGDVCVESMLTL